MLKKMVKITAVLLVLCLAVAAIAVFADSADCYLNKNQYYNKSGYAYGNYATGYLDNYSTSTCSVRANLYGDGGHLAGYVIAARGRTATISQVSGHSAWYIYLQPSGSSTGLGGEAHGRVDTTLTGR